MRVYSSLGIGMTFTALDRRGRAREVVQATLVKNMTGRSSY